MKECFITCLFVNVIHHFMKSEGKYVRGWMELQLKKTVQPREEMLKV